MGLHLGGYEPISVFFLFFFLGGGVQAHLVLPIGVRVGVMPFESNMSI